MIVSFQNSEQKLTKFVNFWNSRREFRNSSGNSCDGEFPGIPFSNGNSRWPWFNDYTVCGESGEM